MGGDGGGGGGGAEMAGARGMSREMKPLNLLQSLLPGVGVQTGKGIKKCKRK